MRQTIIVILIFLGLAGTWYFYHNKSQSQPVVSHSGASKSIYDLSRVTKKPFGIYITPQNSPVQPERFSGYHTGTDFETGAEEVNFDVEVPAFCDGKLLLKEYARGYGGVAVESCVLKGGPVTVIYGHLKLTSIVVKIGQSLKKGDQIGILGQGYSLETDGERKHLHLGVYKGLAVNIKGYVQVQGDLGNWYNPTDFLH